MDIELDTRDEIWMVEVGEHGWSRLCHSYEEAVQAAKEHTDWLDETQEIMRARQVLISRNGEPYTQYSLKHGQGYPLL